jgi:tetratricopeptide (TPR) repeat protein
LQLFLERPRQALHLLEQGCRLYRKTKNAVGMVRSLNLLAEAHRLLGRHEEAERVLEDARERQKKIGAVGNCEWESLMVLSKAALDTGNLERAATYLAEARSKTPQDTRSALKLLERRSQLELQGARFAAALETARRGLEKAQGAENSLRSNFFLESQVWLYLRLGQTELARAALTSLAEVVWHYRLPVHLGRAEVLEAVTSMREGRSGEAAGCFQRADGIFREEQSERDLAQLHFQEAAFLLERGDHEATFLLLEEALYLAKKLNLHFLRTQLYLKLGLFESRIPEVDPRRVGGYLRRAEKLASEAPYPDLLWQTHYHLGCFLRDSGALQESESLLLSARSGRERILRGLPAELVEGYLRASPGSDLERLGEEVETSAPGGARFDVGQF